MLRNMSRPNSIAAISLCRIEILISSPDNGRRRIIGFELRDTKGNRDIAERFVSGFPLELFHFYRATHAFEHRDGIMAGNSGHDDHEFFAAISGHKVVFKDQTVERCSHKPNDLIACLMAPIVIEGFGYLSGDLGNSALLYVSLQ